jgi:ornithine cyclodeaminase/alanine dehydrogenase-like protein (mu-crystallin family)
MIIKHQGTLLLSKSEIAGLLDFADYVRAVENAFRLHAEGLVLKPELMHVDAPAGEFHIKAGGLKSSRPVFALKANGGFFRNRERFGMPNIQGAIILADAENGYPLAIMDSTEITRQRTGAATAVAAEISGSQEFGNRDCLRQRSAGARSARCARPRFAAQTALLFTDETGQSSRVLLRNERRARLFG